MTWELGGGLGHITSLRRVGQELTARGHTVFAAVRDLRWAHKIFDGSEIQPLQAPFKQRANSSSTNRILSYAHILRNTSFGNADELSGLADAWRNLIELLQPDVILFNHSPTALLASRAFSAKRFIVGTGFEFPPDTNPLPVIRPCEDPAALSIADDEAAIIENANSILNKWLAAPILSLSQLYHPIDGVYLFSIPELDTFGPREGVHYLGIDSRIAGEIPQWPAGEGKRVLAYLKPFKCLETLLQILSQMPVQTLIYAPEVGESIKQKYEGKAVRFAPNPIDLNAAAKQCDAAILNGTNATVGQILMAGIPMLNIPLVLEQDYNSRAVQRLGAGLIASPNRPAELAARVTDLFTSEQLYENAKSFAQNSSPKSDGIDSLIQQIESSR